MNERCRGTGSAISTNEDGMQSAGIAVVQRDPSYGAGAECRRRFLRAAKFLLELTIDFFQGKASFLCDPAALFKLGDEFDGSFKFHGFHPDNAERGGNVPV